MSQDILLWIEQTLNTSTPKTFMLHCRIELDWQLIETIYVNEGITAQEVYSIVERCLDNAKRMRKIELGIVDCKLSAWNKIRLIGEASFEIHNKGPQEIVKNDNKNAWEYYQVVTDGDCISMDKLNELGALRWNLISIIDRNGRNYIYYFKRQKAD